MSLRCGSFESGTNITKGFPRYILSKIIEEKSDTIKLVFERIPDISSSSI